MSLGFETKAAPLEGVMLIDASAGTGKTYTIASLVVRLLVEKGLAVDEILVVTYTEAAVEDLKTRIRERIIAAAAVLAGAENGDPSLVEMLAGTRDRQRAAQLLTVAIRNFDEASIFTIHGFCRRVLNEHSLESGILFDTELITDQQDLLREITEDFFRINFYGCSSLVASYCFRQLLPPNLIRKLGSVVAREDVRIIPEIDGDDCRRRLGGHEAEYRALFTILKESWPRKRGDIAAILLESGALNRNKYRLKSVAGWLAAMDRTAVLSEPPARLFEDFGKFTSAALAAGVKTGQAPPADSFFDLCEKLYNSWLDLEKTLRAYAMHLEGELFAFVRRELKARKEAAGSHSFDDLLNDLDRALKSERGERLAGLLRAKYQATLIDEFQDTDPVQYAIFSRVFMASGALLYLIGDPKQAIYSFRGADIFAYIRAVREVGRRYTLGENWRSVPGLIKAVNAVFESRPVPFVFDEIIFDPARAADKNHQLLKIDDEEEAPFQLALFRRQNSPGETGSLLNKDEARQLVLNWQTAEIVRLLDLGRQGRALLGERPLAAGDVAVLVRTNREARLARKALALAGVASAVKSSESLFASREAGEVKIILSAVVEAGSSRRARAALATRIIGAGGRDLDLFSENNELLGDWLQRFREYQRLWSGRGFAVMFSTLLEREGVRPRLLAMAEGERSLTNVLHLLEVLHVAGEEGDLGMAGLVKLLGERIGAIGQQPADELQLRLESDAELVQIVTIHKAKGLQYPVVFCPFCWEGSRLAGRARQDRAYLFHDQGTGGGLKLDIGSAEADGNRLLAMREEMAENLRLLYVALTRGVQRCYLAWGPFSGAGSSPLAYLLHSGGTEDADLGQPWAVDHLHEVSDARMRADLERLAGRAAGAISLDLVGAPPPAGFFEVAAEGRAVTHRRFGGALTTNWRVSSFSSLSRKQKRTPFVTELRPDSAAAGGLSPGGGIREFPRGTAAGTFLHSLLEDLDFSTIDQSRMPAFLHERLVAAGYDPAWTGALESLIENLLNTALLPDNPDLLLAKVSPAERLNELEFYFPLADFNPAALNVLLADWSLAGWPEETIRGFMKGYIDLVFRRGEKYYIVDWKSNFLGNNPEDYQPANLREVMIRDCYCLQYLIYTVALHRYLAVRLPEYRYEEHFGGVFYVFLRGLDPQAGAGSGVFRDKPALALVESLAALLSG